MLNKEDSRPIYIQIAEWIENEIIDESLRADEKVYSQYQLAELFNINPATAGKGLTLLLDDGIIYKKRGLGTFVSPNGLEKLLLKRKNETLRPLISQLLSEAHLLNISFQELLTLLETEEETRGK